jgi:hypothetical protein
VDPLITNGIDPALLRVAEKRGQGRDQETSRRRMPVSESTSSESDEEKQDPDTPKHELDDLA